MSQKHEISVKESKGTFNILILNCESKYQLIHK